MQARSAILKSTALAALLATSLSVAQAASFTAPTSAVLTLLMAAALLVAGIFRIFAAWRVRPDKGWGWLIRPVCLNRPGWGCRMERHLERRGLSGLILVVPGACYNRPWNG